MTDDPRKLFEDAAKIIKGLEGELRFFDERAARAQQRWARELDLRGVGGHIYVGLSSIRLDVENVYIGGEDHPLAIVRVLQETPGEVELARALRNKADFGYAARYAKSMSHELIIPIAKGDVQAALNRAWAITSLMRIRASGEFLSPAYCNVPWSSIAAFQDSSCEIHFLDEFPRATRFSEIPHFRLVDFQWIRDHIVHWYEIWTDERFRLAAESYWSYNQHPNSRIAVAHIWSGIEALFNIHGEITFRLSAIIASLLEPRGQARADLFRRLTRSYATRSKIVHGTSLDQSKIKDHIVEMAGILARLLTQSVERSKLWSQEELDQVLFA